MDAISTSCWQWAKILFFQTSWSVVSDEVVDAVLIFFSIW